MYPKKTFVFLILLFCLFNASAADVESNKVYRFVNVGKSDQSLAISNTGNGAVSTTTDKNSKKQQWYILANDAGTGYYIRNVSTGAYLTSPKAYYTQWPLAYVSTPEDDNMLMTITPYGDNYVIKAASQGGGYFYAHSDAANNIVCWTAESINTQWVPQKVDYSDEEIAGILDSFKKRADDIAKAPEYEKYLESLFEDKACTVLKSGLDLSNNTNYLSLPPKLKQMVDKIKSNNWDEVKGDWSGQYAKKYRIQLYEPYSEGAAAAGLAGIQAYTNMNNPTGIIADEDEMLYVMVDSDIPEGATLYLGPVPDCNMYNSVTSGYKLKKGLNMILCNSNLTHYFIYYTVNTVENNKAARSLKNYEPIKIHIEGGKINGFFNYVGDELYKPDTREDFIYTTSRALHPMYDLIGKYVILHFFLQDTPDTPDDTRLQLGVKNSFDPIKNPGTNRQYDPVKTMQSWDDMCFTERILMGIQSDKDIQNPFNRGFYSSIIGDKYSVGNYEFNPQVRYEEYFNNRMMGFTYQGAGLYMNATSWRTAYAPSTLNVILTLFPQEGIWGPAHEYGHINQGPIKFAGTTEESNNVFSNVANYFLCGTTSRCNIPSDQLKIFNQDKTYLEHGTWGTTRMFWQLWCYYHAAGRNTKFYPRLYELLRKYPLKKDMDTYPGKLNPRYDMLHFAKMCCVAAEEDLTDFFTSWGFFIPLDNYHIDDYSVYDCILTQEDINEVKREIAEFGFKKNHAIILIDDRPGSDLPSGFGYDKTKCGEYGGLKAFTENVRISGDFDYFLDGEILVVTTSGSPGAGYLVYDNEGNLIAFSNSNRFPLSEKAQKLIKENKATVYCVGCDNEMKPISNSASAESVFSSDSPVDVYNINGVLIGKKLDRQALDILSPGIYILKQGKSTRKIIKR